MASCDHNLFYASRVEHGIAYLDNEESRHAMSVLRLSRGDAIQVTDGRGAVYGCRVQERTSSTLSAEIVSTNQVPKPRCSVHMFIGLCDRDKFEDLAENLSALGAGSLRWYAAILRSRGGAHGTNTLRGSTKSWSQASSSLITRGFPCATGRPRFQMRFPKQSRGLL